MVFTHIDGMRVRGRSVVVVVIRVLVVGVRVHVLQRRRSGDRQHGHGNEGGDSAEHFRECMGTVWRRQTPSAKQQCKAVALPAGVPLDSRGMMKPSAPLNRLYYGDNLDVLRRHIDDESVDLVYLDPPFNSNANYNVLFAERDGTQAASQI